MTSSKNTSGEPQNINDFRELFGTAYNPALKAYTQSIQTNPTKVSQLEQAYSALYEMDKGTTFNWFGTTEQDDLLHKAVEAQEILEEFLADGPSCEQYLIVTNHGPSVTIEMGWIQDRVGPVSWDRWTQPFEDPVMAYVALAYSFDLSRYMCAAEATVKADPPMYRYHPERFKANRNYAEEVGKIYRQRVDQATGLMTLQQLNEVMGKVVAEVNSKKMAYPRRHRMDAPGPSLVIDAEQALSTAYGRFVQAGRQIMDFPRSLTDMLAKTDVDDIPLSMIRMPYASQYVHFWHRMKWKLRPVGWWMVLMWSREAKLAT